MAPGHELSTRGLAAELGVSQTPVRDALSRLAADGAVEIRTKRRIVVPVMTQERFDDLLRCRLLLEPVAAEHALEYLDARGIASMREIDAAPCRESGQQRALVLDSHVQLVDAEIPGAQFEGPRTASADDGHLDAGPLQHLDAVAVQAGKGLDLVALRTEIERAIGQHAVHVEAHQHKPRGFVACRRHQTTFARNRSCMFSAPHSAPASSLTSS